MRNFIKNEKGNTTLNIIIFILIIAVLTVLVLYFTKNSKEISEDTKIKNSSLNIPMYLAKEFTFDEKYNTEDKLQIVESVQPKGNNLYINFTNGDVCKFEDNVLYLNDKVIVENIYKFSAELSNDGDIEILDIKYQLTENDVETSSPFSYDHQVVEQTLTEEELAIESEQEDVYEYELEEDQNLEQEQQSEVEVVN